jgi:hypothetical protein
MAYTNNQFKNFQWCTTTHADAFEVAISEADTWDTRLISDLSIVLVYNGITQDRGKFFFDGGKGWYVINMSFNAGGGGDALNSNLGLRFGWGAGESYQTFSTPFLWNNKGGNYWSLNHSAVMYINNSDDSNANSSLVTQFKNIDNTGNFNVKNVTINILRIL